MSDSIQNNWMSKLSYSLAFILVLMGLVNNLPNIPGLLELIQSVPGLSGLPRISKFNSEFFFPLTFIFMIVIALLRSSFTSDWQDQGNIKYTIGFHKKLSN